MIRNSSGGSGNGDGNGDGDGDGQRLTKKGLERLTTETRRQEARRRGRSTPARSPKLREDSSPSFPPPFPRATMRHLSEKPDLPRIRPLRRSLLRSRPSRQPSLPPRPPPPQRSYYDASARPTGDADPVRPSPHPKPRVAKDPRLPANFPTYRVTSSLNEAAAYLANASYFISVGGPPAADLKYGIIAVPVGEEAVLFGPRPDHVVNQAFLDAVTDANREYFNEEIPLHDPDGDSDEFVRRRFDGHHSSAPSLSGFRRVELTPPRVVEGDGEQGGQREDEEEEDTVMEEAAEGEGEDWGEKKDEGRQGQDGGDGIECAARDQAAD